MEPQNHAVVGVLIAALGGLAVGLERQRSGHASGPRSRFAGVRTFTLLGALAGLSGWLWGYGFHAPSIILITGASALIVAAYIAASRIEIDATTEVAAFVVIAAGFIAAIGSWALAGGVIAVTTLLLVEKSRLHEIARSLDDTAMRAGVRFGVMAIVILPLLPEGPFGPWGGIRPRTLWLAVLMFSGLSFAGYLARRAFRGSSGYPLAGMLGGLFSSTAVTLSFSRLSHAERQQYRSLGLGVIGASTILYLRVAVATVALNHDLARVAIPYFVLPLIAGALVMAAGMRLSKDASDLKEQVTGNPLQFWTSLQMAAFFQCAFYIIHWVNGVWGNQGLLVSGAFLGFTDVDALTISMARGAHGASWDIAARALSIGILSNTVLKTGVALVVGRGRFRWIAAGGLVAIGIAQVVSLLLLTLS